MKCHGFPGPGVEAEHIYTMNPAKEFIEGHTGHVDETFSSWKTQHGKQYQDLNETIRRKDIYRQNLRYIHSTNRKHLTYSLASNHLVDLTDSEMRFRKGKLKSTGNNGGLSYTYTQQELRSAPSSLGKYSLGIIQTTEAIFDKNCTCCVFEYCTFSLFRLEVIWSSCSSKGSSIVWILLVIWYSRNIGRSLVSENRKNDQTFSTGASRL